MNDNNIKYDHEFVEATVNNIKNILTLGNCSWFDMDGLKEMGDEFNQSSRVSMALGYIEAIKFQMNWSEFKLRQEIKKNSDTPKPEETSDTTTIIDKIKTTLRDKK